VFVVIVVVCFSDHFPLVGEMSVPTIVNTDDSVSGGTDTRNLTKDTRLRWTPFKKTMLVKGEEVVTFPFLQKDNFKDLMFVNLLLVERPFKAGYGSTIKAWDDIAAQLRDVKHPESGEPLYGAKAIRGKALKERFLAIMDFVKHQDRDALRRTGTDDEPEPGEIENAIADLYSDWQSHCTQGDSKSQSEAAKKKQDRDAAEAVHQASLGNMTAIYASDDLSDPDAEAGPLQTPSNNRRLSYGSRGNTTSSSATSKRSRSPVFLGQQNEAIQELLTRSQERDEARAMSK
jgi:hypothetical protein